MTKTREKEGDFATLAAAVDRAMERVGQLPEEFREVTLKLKEALEALNAQALTTLVRLLRQDPRGEELLYEALDQPEVYQLFLSHGIIQPSLESRVAQVLELVRPYVRSHGGDVELVEVQGDTAFVRLHGSCSGCSMSAQTLKHGVEAAITGRIPEIRRVQEVKEEAVAGFIPLEQIALGGTLEGLGWVQGPPAKTLREGEPYRLQTQGYDVLLVRLEGRVFAYRNRCPHMGMTLDKGICDSGILTCPWHGLRFDLSSGECVSAPHVQLEPFPLRIEDDVIWVRPS
jgi:nitrite reductase/ring-hydroxylating ferredoxin subunit/Fe-S cluster biogenesis protein NfuA